MPTPAQECSNAGRPPIPGRRGEHLWAQLPAGVDDVETALVARRSGVVALPGRAFWPAEAPAAHLRLTFSAVPFGADLDVAVRRLAVAVPELT